MVVTPAGDPCIIAVPYQGTLNFASFFAPKKVREKTLLFLRAEALGILRPGGQVRYYAKKREKLISNFSP